MGIKHSTKTRMKMSQQRKNRKHSQETLERMRAAQEKRIQIVDFAVAGEGQQRTISARRRYGSDEHGSTHKRPQEYLHPAVPSVLEI
jgi:hypothetical protein